jgi:hypothetical protein
VWQQDPYRCEHDHTEIRRRTVAGGRVQYWQQCQRCGHGPRAVKPSLSAVMGGIPDWDEELNERWDRERSAWYEARRKNWEEDQAREKAEFWERYEAYLQTPEWREKRARVLERAGGVCEGCGERRPVHAHHLTYERVGDEMLFDLAAVCRDCHEKLHPHMATNVVGKVGRYTG